MAYLLASKNYNQDLLDQAIYVKTGEKIKEAKNEHDRYVCRSYLAAAFLAVSIVALLLLIFKEGLMLNIRTEAKEAFGRWAVASGQKWNDCRKLKGIIDILPFAFWALCGILSGILYLVAPILVPVCIYGVLGFIFLWCIFTITDKEPVMNVEALKEKAKQELSDENQILRAGIEGEQKAIDMVVHGLGNDCYVFSNLQIYYDGGRNEADLLVVSPSGITLCEVKNYSGVLYGDISDRELTCVKVLKNGETKRKTESNPFTQVRAPIHRLKGYLKDHGISTYIRACALFVNENVSFELTDRDYVSDRCRIFSIHDSEEFLNYLNDYREQRLSAEEIRKIVLALRRHVVS